MTKWKDGEHYLRTKESLWGPFSGRVYTTFVPLDVYVPGLVWTPEVDQVVCGRIRICKPGRLFVIPGYAYDGPSGPTWDDATNMRAACMHDAMYGLLRRDVLGLAGSPAWEHNRHMADAHMGRMMRGDGAWGWRASYYVWALRMFGAKHARR